MERKLVTIRTISELRPIPDADAIETAVVDGWTCVVKKGEFKTGDLGVYFEIDSLLPLADERFSFLRKGAVGQEFHRLRTIKLRKQLSQGLLLHIDSFPELLQVDPDSLTDALGILKWEPKMPACLAGKVKSNFPSFIQKTDEERIQNMPWVLTQEADSLFEISVKLDGSSMTVFYNDGEFGVCSRNLQLLESEDNTFWKVANRLGIREALAALGRNVAIQGELMGPGVQGNREGLKDHNIYVFKVFDIDTQRYMDYLSAYVVIQNLKSLGCELASVPYISVAILGLWPTMDAILKFADGPSLNHAMREGLVFKRIDGGLSFKVISNAFLLAEK